MLDEEYIKEVIKEWERRGRGTSPHLDDDLDWFDELNFFELLEDDE